MLAIAPDGTEAWRVNLAANGQGGPQAAAASVFSPVVSGPNVAALFYISTSRSDIDRTIGVFDRATGAPVWSQRTSTA